MDQTTGVGCFECDMCAHSLLDVTDSLFAKLYPISKEFEVRRAFNNNNEITSNFDGGLFRGNVNAFFCLPFFFFVFVFGRPWRLDILPRSGYST